MDTYKFDHMSDFDLALMLPTLNAPEDKEFKRAVQLELSRRAKLPKKDSQ